MFFFSIYFIIFLWLATLSLLSITVEAKKYTPFLLFISFLILVLLAGLRAHSPDQPSYNRIFMYSLSIFEIIEYGNNFDDFPWIQKGFLALYSLIKTFTNSVVVMSFVIATLTIGTVTYSVNRLSPYPVVSMLVYFSWFYYFNLGSLRHSIISAFLLLLAVFIFNSKYIKSFILILISGGMHSVAYTSIVLFFGRFKIKKYLYIFTLIISIVIAISGGIVYLGLSKFAYLLPELTQIKIRRYIGFGIFSISNPIISGLTVKSVFLIGITIFNMDILYKKFDAFPIILFGYAVSVFTFFLFIDFKIIADRTSHFYSIFEIILIPMLLSIIRKEDRLFAFFILGCFLSYQLTLLYGEELYLYKSVLDYEGNRYCDIFLCK